MNRPSVASTVPSTINWQLLSRESQAILRLVLVPMHLGGYSKMEIAKRLEIPPSSVKLLTTYFTDEIEAQSAGRR